MESLKSVEKLFWKRSFATHLKSISVLDKPLIKSGDKIIRRKFQQSRKCNITWIENMGYKFSFKSNQTLYKGIKEATKIYETIVLWVLEYKSFSAMNVYNLTEFEQRLEKYMQNVLTRCWTLLRPMKNIKSSSLPLFCRIDIWTYSHRDKKL